MTQKFKGDATELSIEAAAEQVFDRITADQVEYLAGCFTAADFLLMLYDENRMPFSARVPRDAFAAFARQYVPNSQFIGTFESYLFLIKGIFGEGAETLFVVPAAGKLEITIDAPEAGIDFPFLVRSYEDGELKDFEVITSDGYLLNFSGLTGIDSEAELAQLLAELIPAGIYPTVSLTFFTLSSWLSYESGVYFTMIDSFNNEIAFYEIGA